MKFPRPALAALSFLAVFLLALAPIYVDDLFLYMTFGRMLFEGGTLPTVDPLIFTIPDHHWQLWHEWLSYLLYYGTYSAGGFNGILLLRGLLAALAALLVWRACARAGLGAGVSLIIWGSAVIAAFPRCFRDRTSGISDLLTVLLLYLLTDERFLSPGNRRKWFLPALFAVWVQFHSGYLIAWFILGLFYWSHFVRWNARERRDWLAVCTLSVLATALNPEFIEGALWPVRAIFGGDWGVLGQISEFEPTLSSPSLDLTYKIFFCVFVASTLVATFRRVRTQPFLFLTALTLTYLGLRYTRMVAYAGFGLSLLTAVSMAVALPTKTRTPKNGRGEWIVGGALSLLCAFLMFFPARGFRFLVAGDLLHSSVPQAGVAALMQLPPGHIFNEWSLGSYLAWELDGRQKIAAHGFISDPRLVEEKIYRFSVSREGWDEIILRGNVEYFFLRRQTFEESRQAVWVRELLGPGWQPMFMDGAAVIFRRVR